MASSPSGHRALTIYRHRAQELFEAGLFRAAIQMAQLRVTTAQQVNMRTGSRAPRLADRSPRQQPFSAPGGKNPKRHAVEKLPSCRIGAGGSPSRIVCVPPRLPQLHSAPAWYHALLVAAFPFGQDVSPLTISRHISPSLLIVTSGIWSWQRRRPSRTW